MRIFLFLLILDACSGELKLKSVESCKSKKTLLEFNSTIVNNVLNGFVHIKEPLDHYPGYFTISYTPKIDSDNFIKMTKIEYKDTCKAIERYVGVVWSDVARAAHLPTGCPVRKGLYQIKDFQINMNRFSMQALPKGKIQIVSENFVKPGVVFSCMEYTILNTD